METLWPTLVQFLLRLSFGLATAMVVTPAKWVTSGFFRVHLWVLMGLGTFTALAISSRWTWYAAHSSPSIVLGLTIGAAALSYLGAIAWMYEARQLGKALLLVVAALFLAAGMTAAPWHEDAHFLQFLTFVADHVAGSFVLGTFMAAMLLGHWYLNNPGMKLEPLRRLVGLCAAALVVRALLSTAGMAYLGSAGQLPSGTIGWSFLAFRWLAGLVGPAAMAWLTWETLKIPNTQSATGILYAAVTLTFLGELTSQLLSRSLLIPV